MDLAVRSRPSTRAKKCQRLRLGSCPDRCVSALSVDGRVSASQQLRPGGQGRIPQEVGLLMHRTLWLALWALTCCLELCASGAKAEDFYRGKTITLLVGNTAGGGYDFYARMLVRYMGKYIPGEPSFIVKN